MALGTVAPSPPTGGTTGGGGGGGAGSGIVPFVRLPPPPTPPSVVPPPGAPPSPPTGGTAGTVGRALEVAAPIVARRWPPIGAAAAIIGGLLVGWGLSNSRPQTTKTEPTTTNPTAWKVQTGPGTSWQVRIRGFGGENYGQAHLDYWRNWLAPNQKYENGSWTAGDWLAEGGGELVAFKTTSEQVGYPIAGYNFLLVEVETTSTTGEKKRWRMGDFGTKHEVEIFPITALPGGGQDAFPTNPPPYLPPVRFPPPDTPQKKPSPKPGPVITPKIKPAPSPGSPKRLPEPETDPQRTPKVPDKLAPPRPPEQRPQVPGSKQMPSIGTAGTKQPGPGDGPNKDPGPTDKNQPGPGDWKKTDPTNDKQKVEPDKPAPPKQTPQGQTLLKDGTKLDPPPIPPTPEASAKELAKLEKKMELQLENMGDFLEDLVNLLGIAGAILELLQASGAAKQYTITAPCKEQGENEPRSFTVTAPGASSFAEVALNRLDAIASLIREGQLMTVKTCGKQRSTPTNNVTVTAFEVIE